MKFVYALACEIENHEISLKLSSGNPAGRRLKPFNVVQLYFTASWPNGILTIYSVDVIFAYYIIIISVVGSLLSLYFGASPRKDDSIQFYPLCISCPVNLTSCTMA